MGTSKPIDQKIINKMTPRERLWAEIRRTPVDFTREEVSARARMKPEAARRHLRGWEAAGYIQLTYLEEVKPSRWTPGGNRFPRRHYGLANDVGAEAPCVNIRGEPIVQGQVRQAMWTVLRINGGVDSRLLANYASSGGVKVSQITARQYLAILHQAGYVDVVADEVPGFTGATYRLCPKHNTGPRAPMIQRAHQLFDPNLAEVVWREEPHLEEERQEGLADELA